MNLLLLFLPLMLFRFVNLMFPMDFEWYNSLKQSPYTPSGHIFVPVWLVLYLLIGWGLSLPNSEWLTFNFGLNLLWLIMFNSYHDLKLSFWILMLMNFSLIMHIQRTNQWFLVPYLIWCLYATYLNGYLMQNNI